MNNIEALLIRNRFKATPGYEELIKYFPKLDEALNALPDESKMFFNVLIMEMYKDAKKWAKGLIEKNKERTCQS